MKKTSQIFIAILLTTLSAGCKKFVEIDPPKNQLITETVFQSNENANAAQLNIYAAMVDEGLMSYRVPLYTGIAGDELKNYSISKGNMQLYTNTLNSSDALTNTIWSAAYKYIYQANAVVEGCQNSSALNDAVKKQLIAESSFLRAFWHFYLVNFYGAVPIITSTNYVTNSHATNAPSSSVYAQIISDLTNAVQGLNEQYVGADAVSPSDERIRPNKFAAIALLARVYLYTGKYAEAENQSTFILNNNADYQPVALDKIFLKNSKEAIWQLAKPTPNVTNINTPEGNGFILTAKPSASLVASSALSDGLLSAFEDKDHRKTDWIGKNTDKTVTPNVDYYFPFKYKIKSGNDLQEYSTVFRVGEQYLIRAEARAQLGKLQSAIEDLDVIRQRAGLPMIKDSNPGISKDNLLIAIQKERQIELFTEWGHRWLDLKRTAKINAVMTAYAPSKGATWEPFKQFWPVPLTDMQNNTSLTQTPGYN